LRRWPSLLIVFTVALVAGTTQLSAVATLFSTGAVGLRVSLGLGLFAFLFVAVAENARIPIDNPATHLELTMVHEAMVLEYSGRHLAMIEAASAVKLVLYFSLIACLFAPLGIAGPGAGVSDYALGIAAYLGKLIVLAVLLPIGETSVAKMRVFRYPLFVGSAFAAAALAVFLLFVSKGF
jgi:formate hydrogenlyase subunit 4